MDSIRPIPYVFLVLQFFSCFYPIRGQDVVYNLLEGNQIGRSVGIVSLDANLMDIVGASDFDNLRYSFLTIGTPHVGLFNVDEITSNLTTAGAIDRESICEFTQICYVKLNVAAKSDVGNFFMKIEVHVYIDDVNDNSPTFDEPNIDLSISEAVLVGTSITIDGARDADTSDDFSLQSYEILPVETPFEIKYEKKLDGTSVVRLLVKEPLDRETHESYKFQVIAHDGGSPPLTGVLSVNVTILDVNDNSPIFSRGVYHVIVKEDVNISAVITSVKAVDLDDGKNGEVVYRLSPHQSDTILRHFAINNVTGELWVKESLTYIRGERYSIIIEASDLGDQPLASQSLVNITVEDVGNSAPEINVNLLSDSNFSRISELANIGAVVAHIAINDPDTNQNGEVTCSLDNTAFQLQKLENKEYKVIVKEPLDREVSPKLTVTISCQDKGTPPLSTSKSFLVEVEDENDNRPVFELPVYTAGIVENNNVGDVIIQVKANDIDSGNNSRLLYFLGEQETDTFYIDQSQGIVRTNNILDRENISSYMMVVYARDLGVPSLTGSATITVSVLDSNDNYPVFNQTYYTFHVFENQYSGTDVGELFASDKDEGENSFLVFSGPDSTPFTVFPRGMIRTDKPLDREVQSRYDFSAIARDKNHATSVFVTVFVDDENDNSPIVLSPSTTNNTIVIGSNTKVTTVVMNIKATDLDSGINAELKYEIKWRNDSSRFGINSKTGSISLLKDISSDSGKNFRLDIVVSDMGFPIRSTPASLNIIISDVPVSSRSSQNIIIVIILITVTVIISAAILFIIIFIRRKDKLEKQRKQNEYYKQTSVDSSVDSSFTVFPLPGKESILSDKKKKKEVSFSVDSSEDINSQVTSDPNQNSTKQQESSKEHEIEVIEEEIVISFPRAASSNSEKIVEKSYSDRVGEKSRTPPTSVKFRDEVGRKKIVTKLKPASPILGQDQEQSPRSILRNKQPSPVQKRADDSHSLGSASDSGRGGSDDEMHNLRTGSGNTNHSGWLKYQRPLNKEMQTFLSPKTPSYDQFSDSFSTQSGHLNYTYPELSSYLPTSDERTQSNLRQARSVSFELDNEQTSIKLTHSDMQKNDCLV